MMKALFTVIFIISIGAMLSFAQEETPEVPEETPEQTPETEAPHFEGTMTIEKMDEIIKKIDKDVESPQAGAWQFTLANINIMIVTDATNNRMRIMVPIRKSVELTKGELMRIAQANFDSALDARYAVANDVLWAVYIHPLRALHDKQFISALAQTASTAANYGSTYSSGALVYNGGDSQGIMRDQIRDALRGKGLEV